MRIQTQEVLPGMKSVYKMGKPHNRASTRAVEGPRCEAIIKPRWAHVTDDPQCSFVAKFEIDGKHYCTLHARRMRK